MTLCLSVALLLNLDEKPLAQITHSLEAGYDQYVEAIYIFMQILMIW